jgi:hypothetical protein
VIRRFGFQLILIAAAGLVIRVVYVLAVARGAPGFGDFQFYNSTAGLLADGKGFISPFELAYHGQSVPTAAHPPAWSFVLSAVSAVFGNGASPTDLLANDFVAHRLAGCVLGSVGIGLVGLVGERVGGRRVGLVAAIIAALSPSMIAADGSTMSEALYVPLVALTLLTAYALRERRSVWMAVALGAVIGVAALTRAEALLFVVLLGLPVAGVSGATWGRRLALGFAVVATCVVVVAPWTIRNFDAFNRPVLISTNEGFLWALANCRQTYSGPDMGFSRLDCLPQPHITDEAKYSARARDKGLDYAENHLGDLPPVIGVRTLRTWGFWQPFRIKSEGVPNTLNDLTVVFEWFLLAVAVAGAVILRRRRRPLWIVLSPVLLVLVVTALGHGLARYRYGAEPSLMVLAAVAVEAALSRGLRRLQVSMANSAAAARGVATGDPVGPRSGP